MNDPVMLVIPKLDWSRLIYSKNLPRNCYYPWQRWKDRGRGAGVSPPTPSDPTTTGNSTWTFRWRTAPSAWPRPLSPRRPRPLPAAADLAQVPARSGECCDSAVHCFRYGKTDKRLKNQKYNIV